MYYLKNIKGNGLRMREDCNCQASKSTKLYIYIYTYKLNLDGRQNSCITFQGICQLCDQICQYSLNIFPKQFKFGALMIHTRGFCYIDSKIIGFSLHCKKRCKCIIVQCFTKKLLFQFYYIKITCIIQCITCPFFVMVLLAISERKLFLHQSFFSVFSTWHIWKIGLDVRNWIKLRTCHPRLCYTVNKIINTTLLFLPHLSWADLKDLRLYFSQNCSQICLNLC